MLNKTTLLIEAGNAPADSVLHHYDDVLNTLMPAWKAAIQEIGEEKTREANGRHYDEAFEILAPFWKAAIRNIDEGN